MARKADNYGLVLEDEEKEVKVEEKKEEVVEKVTEFEELPEFHTIIRVLSLSDGSAWDNVDGEITIKYLRNGWKLYKVELLRVFDMNQIPTAQMLYMFAKG